MDALPGPAAAPPLKRRELYREIADRAQVPQTEARRVLSVLAEIAVEQIGGAGRFEIPALCFFRVDRRPPRRVVFRGREKSLPERQVLRAFPLKKLREQFFSHIPDA